MSDPEDHGRHRQEDEPIRDAPKPADEQHAPSEERLPSIDKPRPSQAEGERDVDEEDEG